MGLKDFSQNRSSDQVRSSPKLKSVVGILGHLAGSHTKDIRQAIIETFRVCVKIKRDSTEFYIWFSISVKSEGSFYRLRCNTFAEKSNCSIHFAADVLIQYTIVFRMP